jgi:large subunit ribosomal protein L4
MKVKKYDRNGKETGTVDLPEDIFGGEVNRATIHALLRTESRNRRQGTHKTKNFSEVTGGGKKPYRQKGTGNARQGSIRAPHYKGGGISHGPLPRDYRIAMPEKMRKNGLISIFKTRINQNALCVIEDPEVNEFSTKKMYGIFKNMGVLPGNTVAFLSESEGIQLKKSLMNIAQVVFMNAKRMNAPELYHSSKVVLSESALKYITDRYKSA